MGSPTLQTLQDPILLLPGTVSEMGSHFAHVGVLLLD